MTQLPVIIDAAGWRVSFHSCGDRIAHTVGLVVAGRVLPLLASVEGTPDDSWPPSPPLTTVETATARGGQQAMLLGMAGRNHWSVSLVVNEAAGRLEFEVACRLKEPAGRLGSAYRTMVAASDSSGGVEVRVDGETVRVEAPSPAAQVCITPEGLTVPVDPPDGPFPRTVIWKYAVCRLP